jgi:hypothetical protein
MCKFARKHWRHSLTRRNRGGSIVADLALRKGFEGVGLFALVRSDEQIKSFESVAGVEVVRGDLTDERGIIDSILKHKSEFARAGFLRVLTGTVDMIINCATCIDKDVVLTFIKGLSQQKEVSGKPACLIHVGILVSVTYAG